MKEAILAAAKRLGITIPPLMIFAFVGCVAFKVKIEDKELDEAVIECAKKMI